MFDGITERVLKEIEAKAHRTLSVKVIATAHRRFEVWRGGSTISSLSNFSSQLITKKDYEEHGPQIIHKKCL